MNLSSEKSMKSGYFKVEKASIGVVFITLFAMKYVAYWVVYE